MFFVDCTTRILLGWYIRLMYGCIVDEKPVHRNLQRLSHFFKCVNCRNCVTVFHSRDIATEQARSLLDVPLGHILLLTQQLQSFANDHLQFLHPQSAAAILPHGSFLRHPSHRLRKFAGKLEAGKLAGLSVLDFLPGCPE